MKLPSTNRRSEQGFTLVELAIVMIIIGLLLGGLLKGQELISNARVTSTVAQVKALDAGTSGFRDKYDAVPGDLLNPGARLSNCTGAPCNAAGNGDGLVGAAVTFNAAPAGEQVSFFPQLSAAGFISGIQQGAGAAGMAWGRNFPAAEVGGGFHVGYVAGGALLTSQVAGVAGDVRTGHYLALHNAPNAGVGATPAAGTILTPSMAFRIDNKMDDGVPGTGTIFGAGAAACVAAGIYNEIVDANNCNLYIRFQQ